MRQIKEQFRASEKAEQSLLARLITHPDERSVVAALLDQQDLYCPAHRRLYSLIMQMPANLLYPLDASLLEVLHSRADDEGADLLLLLTWSPRPESQAETVLLALHIHDQAVVRARDRVEELALRDWLEDPECTESPIAEDDDW